MLAPSSGPSSDLEPHVANRDQLAAWDGPDGEHWTEQAEHYERTTAPYRDPPARGRTGRGRRLGGRRRLWDRFADSRSGPSGPGRLRPRPRPLAAGCCEHARDLTAAEGIRNASYEQADAGGPAVRTGQRRRGGQQLRRHVLRGPGARLRQPRRRPSSGTVGADSWPGASCPTTSGSPPSARRSRRAASLPVPTPGSQGPFGLADADRASRAARRCRAGRRRPPAARRADVATGTTRSRPTDSCPGWASLVG